MVTATMADPGARTMCLGMQEIAVFVEGARYARQFNDG
ncbi:IS4 family transposase [Polaromonas glacialis]|nr:IS4 family transposase [Polaromonas glacialis]